MSWAWPGSQARNAPRMRPSACREMSCTCRPRMSVYHASERSASRTKMFTWSRAIGLKAIGLSSVPSGMDHGRGATDHERLVAFEEIRHHVGECRGAIRRDRRPGVVDEHQVRVPYPGDAA